MLDFVVCVFLLLFSYRTVTKPHGFSSGIRECFGHPKTINYKENCLQLADFEQIFLGVALEVVIRAEVGCLLSVKFSQLSGRALLAAKPSCTVGSGSMVIKYLF